jgi:hypothetical protein
MRRRGKERLFGTLHAKRAAHAREPFFEIAGAD